MEEYIEVIYDQEIGKGSAHNTDIAAALKVKPASVTEMLQKLEGMGYIDYEPYKGARLTAAGRRVAEELIAKHKTLAKFLEIIGVDEETAEKDACQIEHHVTPRTMEILNKFVEFVRDAPKDPEWLKHFKRFSETGKRTYCKK